MSADQIPLKEEREGISELLGADVAQVSEPMDGKYPRGSG